MTDICYVSWGGTGRAVALRMAMARADKADAPLVYLAILDDSTFGDIDSTLRDLAKDELAWLLDAQLELTKRQTGLEDVAVQLVVRSGDVAQEIIEVVDSLQPAEVLVGAPLPDDSDNAIAELFALVEQRTKTPVVVLEP